MLDKAFAWWPVQTSQGPETAGRITQRQRELQLWFCMPALCWHGKVCLQLQCSALKAVPSAGGHCSATLTCNLHHPVSSASIAWLQSLRQLHRTRVQQLHSSCMLQDVKTM